MWGSQTPGLSRQAPGHTSSAVTGFLLNRKMCRVPRGCGGTRVSVAETAGRWLKGALRPLNQMLCTS